jgi:CubicO group peptidase (beta-lactamase class C family)
MRLRHVFIALWVVCAARAGAQGAGARADSILRAAESAGFSGVVRVDKGGETILQKGYGLANREDRVAFSSETVVDIGSNAKDFTAVAILQLHERGRLSIRDSIGKYFAAARNGKRAITIWQLVTHRAGFPLRLGGDFDTTSRQALIDSAMRTSLLFPAGSRESVSNAGYCLLAAIIEQVSGVSYEEYVRDNILQPLGLTHTGLVLPTFDPRKIARAYEFDRTDAETLLDKPRAADGPYWNLRGSGGVLSTIDDMHAFYHALFETDRLLKPETRKLRFSSDEPAALGGMDSSSYFIYERDPRIGAEIIVASTSFTAPGIRRELGRLLGVSDAIGQDPQRVGRH